MTLCRNYRPQRPFDAIVLAIPASALLDVGPEGEAGLRGRAQALNRRLWQEATTQPGVRSAIRTRAQQLPLIFTTAAHNLLLHRTFFSPTAEAVSDWQT
ncbi:MAG: type VI secretion system protein [Pseudomonadota bacterium]|nr:type VI secretion system protein [Pseudomonadota bacterium]